MKHVKTNIETTIVREKLVVTKMTSQIRDF
jgi:hypothetical protein